MLGMRTPLSGTLTAAPPCSRAQQAAARSVRTDEAVLVSMLVFGPPQQAGQHAVRQCAGRSARNAWRRRTLALSLCPRVCMCDQHRGHRSTGSRSYGCSWYGWRQAASPRRCSGGELPGSERGGGGDTRDMGSARARAATGGQSARNSSSITFRHQTSQVRLTTAISVARVRLTRVRVPASLGPRTRVLRAGSPRQGGSQKAPGCRERRRSRRRTRDRGRGEGSCARDGAGGDEKGGLDHRLGGLSEAARGA